MIDRETQTASTLERRSPLTLARALWGITATALAVLYTAILAPSAAVCAPFADGHAVSHIGRLWAWLIIKTCGVRVEMQGLDYLTGAGPCIIVSNHQSFFDIFAAMAYLPCEVRFVAKKELRKILVFGFALQHANHIVIDRERGQTIRRALAVNRLGYTIMLFAEGHRFSDNQVHPFNQGAAWLAIHTGLPCVPMSVSGSGALFPRNARVVSPGGRMRITFGAPLAVQGLKSADRPELTRRLEEAVRANFTPHL